MTIAMLVILIAVLGLVSGAGLVGFALGRRRLPPSSAPLQDRRLAEQVEMLEQELRRVKDQADFTERLLAERDSVGPGDARPGESTD